jgi:hypothetical protein
VKRKSPVHHVACRSPLEAMFPDPAPVVTVPAAEGRNRGSRIEKPQTEGETADQTALTSKENAMKKAISASVVAALCAVGTAQADIHESVITLPYKLTVAQEKVATYCAAKGGTVAQQTANSLACRFEGRGRQEVDVAGLAVITNYPAIEVRYTLTHVNKGTRVTWSMVPSVEYVTGALNNVIYEGLQGRSTD